MKQPAEIVEHVFLMCEGTPEEHAGCPVAMELKRPSSHRKARRTFYVCRCACHHGDAEAFAPGIPWKD